MIDPRHIYRENLEIFCITPDKPPQHLRNVSVDSILWKKELIEGKGAVIAVLDGLLPDAQALITAKDFLELSFHLNYYEYGIRNEYDENHVVIRLNHCKLISNQLVKPVIRDENDNGILNIVTTLQCYMEILWEAWI